MQNTAIFRRYLSLELILDRAQEPTWVSEPTLFHHTSNTKTKTQETNICLIKSLGTLSQTNTTA